MSLGSATEGQAGEWGIGDLETTAFILGSGENEAERPRDFSRSHSESERSSGLSTLHLMVLSRSSTPLF